MKDVVEEEMRSQTHKCNTKQGVWEFVRAIREIDAERGIEGFGGVVVFGEVWERIARREGGEEGRALVLMVGWESLEAHLVGFFPFPFLSFLLPLFPFLFNFGWGEREEGKEESKSSTQNNTEHHNKHNP